MIIIPMAGLSSRFTRAGYTQPKFMLPLHGHPVFDYSLDGFRACFDSEHFVFVTRPLPGVGDFLKDRITALGIRSFEIIELEEMTRGQAETVLLGARAAGASDRTPITIFNIDTFLRGEYVPYSNQFPDAAGVLQVFEGAGDNWSFVEPDESGSTRVRRTTEKVPISNLCCTGLYHFAEFAAYEAAYDAELATPQSSELYVAPMYNHLIASGQRVDYDLIPRSDVVFCGVPQEYEALRDDEGFRL